MSTVSAERGHLGEKLRKPWRVRRDIHEPLRQWQLQRESPCDPDYAPLYRVHLPPPGPPKLLYQPDARAFVLDVHLPPAVAPRELVAISRQKRRRLQEQLGRLPFAAQQIEQVKVLVPAHPPPPEYAVVVPLAGLRRSVRRDHQAP